MANQKDLDFTYTTIDEIFRLSMGEMGDFSGAMFNGDFSLSLEEAQDRKHRFIAENLHIRPGSKVLDMGCGWGPFLNYIRKSGAKGMGVTLSSGQAKACVRNGLDVKVMDCRKITPEMYGTFDAISCVGVFEHICSVEDYTSGKQDEVYRNFFKTAYDLLPPGGRFYLQTMVFSKNMLPLEKILGTHNKGSDAHVLSLMMDEFPGSWLPYGVEQVVNNAAPYFTLQSKSSGRLDYIETIRRWRKKFRKFHLKKYFLYGSVVPKILTDRAFRKRLEVFRISPNKVCFEREIMDHYRLVFEKV